MRYVKVLIAIAVLGAYPAAALAHGAPTKSQRTALIKAFDGYVKEPVPGTCLKEVVSTPNTSWAEIHYGFDKLGHLPAVCAKFAANGEVIFHLTRGRWRWVASGSDFRNGNGSCSLTKRVPSRVIADLRLC
jgi:hypothetical protein